MLTIDGEGVLQCADDDYRSPWILWLWGSQLLHVLYWLGSVGNCDLAFGPPVRHVFPVPSRRLLMGVTREDEGEDYVSGKI